MPTKKALAKKVAPAKKAATKKAPAKKAVAKKAPSEKVVPAKKAPAKKSVTKPAAKKASAPKKESVMKELKVGDQVLVLINPRQNGGSDEAVGFVTKAMGNYVNVRVLPDSGENLWLTSVEVVSKRPKDDEGDENETASEAKVRTKVCWPA